MNPYAKFVPMQPFGRHTRLHSVASKTRHRLHFTQHLLMVDKLKEPNDVFSLMPGAWYTVGLYYSNITVICTRIFTHPYSLSVVQVARLSQRGRAMLRVNEYFAKSLKVTYTYTYTQKLSL